VPRRPLLVLPVLLVLVAAAMVVLRDGRPYRVTMTVADAGQLVDGNEVRVAGAVVGKVDGIDLTDDGRARVTLRIDDERLRPLHRGTRAIIRNSSLSSVAGRIVVLEAGPDDAPAIPDGGGLAAVDARGTTDIDQVLNTLDSASMDAIRRIATGGARTLAGAEDATRLLLERLSPAVARTGALARALTDDRGTLERLVVSGATTAGAVADRREDVTVGIAQTAAVLRATADRRGELSATLRRAPAVLRQASTTFAGFRGLVTDLRPALREARRIAPGLADLLRLLGPLADDALPVVRDLRATVPRLTVALRRTPALAEAGVPALRETTTALRPLRPVISDVRAYTPDIVHGLVVGFGGKAASLYDANGHIGRLEPVVNMATLPSVLEGLGPLLGTSIGANLGDFTTRNVNRCPGSATQAAADGSNPWAVGGCDARQVPPGGERTR